MSTKPILPPRPLPAILLEVKNAALARFFVRLHEEGFTEIREGHGCVFGFIDAEQGSRLTDLAERAGLTKQAVGEAVAELERLGYMERVPDPRDKRAKIIKPTPHGIEAIMTGRRLFQEIEREWADQFGEELLANLREAAERISASERGAAGARPRSAA